MKTGTPGFVSDRLKTAREARGIMSAAALAEMVGVSRAAMSLFERGEQSPSADTLARISTVLNLPVHHFLQPQSTATEKLFFRSLSSATQGIRRRAARRQAWLRDICKFLERYIRFPKLNIPDLDFSDDPRVIRQSDIEVAATRTRRHWGLGDGPISNVAWLLENNGFVVTRSDLGADDLDAFSQWASDLERPFVIVGTEKGSATRSRFNLCHELAHMLMHRNVAPSLTENAAVFKLIEDQANRFASAFLMPASTFAPEVPYASLDVFKHLKPRWQVSIAAMIHRFEDLDLLKGEEARRLWINLSRRGWRSSEPLDDTIPAEQPRYLQRCFESILANRLTSRTELPFQIGLSARDIEQLAGLAEGLLGQPSTATNALEASIPEVEPEVIRFPNPVPQH